MVARVILALLMWTLAASVGLGQTPTDIDGLIRRLGSSVYAERAKAQRELEAIGVPALDLLKHARQPADRETQSRLRQLIQKAEEKLLIEQILTPKMVELSFVKTTVDEVINQLSKQAYPLRFEGQLRPKDAYKKFTFNTGKTTFWKALDQYCDQFDLIEQIETQPIRPATTVLRVGKKGLLNSPAGNEPRAAPDQIVLTNRGNKKVLSSYAGAVKVMLHITRDGAAKELVLHFTTSIEPRLLNGALVGRPIIETAVNSQGRKLIETAATPSPAAPNGEGIRFAITDHSGQPASPRQTQIRVKDDASIQRIRELVGKLTLQVDLPNETVAKVANVLDAAGKSADGTNGGSLKVNSVRKVGDDIEVQVSMTNLTPNPFGNNIIINGGNVIIRGNINIQGGIVIGPNGVSVNGQSVNSRPDLIDAKGQKFQVVSANSNGTSINAGVVSTSATIVYRPHPGQAAPRDLVLFGNRTHTIAVPFRFENVPLP